MSGRYHNKRDANEAEIVEYLRKLGFTVSHMDKPVDLLIGKGGRTWCAEVKMPEGKLRPAQVRFFETWRGNHLILRSTQDADKFAAEVKKEMT